MKNKLPDSRFSRWKSFLFFYWYGSNRPLINFELPIPPHELCKAKKHKG